MRAHYNFIRTRFAGGGNAANRSSTRHEQEITYLHRKWGQFLSVAQAKGTTQLVEEVAR